MRLGLVMVLDEGIAVVELAGAETGENRLARWVS